MTSAPPHAPLDDPTLGLRRFLDASPTPFHACASAAELLQRNGYTELSEAERFPREPGRYLVRRGGSLIAWDSRGGAGSFRIVGAHTDSPNLRIKPQPEVSRAGWELLGVEVYGGPLLNSWLDRDLGLAGRVSVREGSGVRTALVHVSDPILRVSQLAVHLDRGVNDRGLTLNPQQHLTPHWGNSGAPVALDSWLGEQLGVDAADVLAWELMTFDLTPARLIGREQDLLASGRLDNLATSHAAVQALCSLAEDETADGTRVIVLFDHEEVGSTSATGAGSTLLPTVLERIVLAAGGDREDLLAASARSVVASGDMAHATHPNYAERHEPEHRIAINGGPVLKVNHNLRYATDAPGAALFALACEQAGVPMQRFVTRSDLPCGSTVGPTTGALTGITTVDFGAAMLSMHSAREVCGALDVPRYVAALTAFLAPA